MQPHGIATIGASSSSDKGYYLIIADTGNNRVQVLSAITGQFSQLIGGTIKGGKRGSFIRFLLSQFFTDNRNNNIVCYKCCIVFLKRNEQAAKCLQ